MSRPQQSNLGPSLSRRALLRGLGVALALPAFESLQGKASVANAAVNAAGAQTATGAPLRMAFMSIPNGVQQAHWFPKSNAADWQLSDTLSALEPVKQHIQVISVWIMRTQPLGLMAREIMHEPMPLF